MSVLQALPAIYDTVLSRSHWTPALDAVSRAVSSVGAIIYVRNDLDFQYDTSAQSSHFVDRSGAVDLYREKFNDYDRESMEVVFQTPAFVPVKDSDVWPGEDKLHLREDVDFLRSTLGVYRRFGLNLFSGDGWQACLAVQFDPSKTQIDPASVKAACDLGPHIAKALEMNRFFHKLEQRYQAILAALDHVRIGICITDTKAEVIIKNRAAQQILEAKDGLRLDPGGHLCGTLQDLTNRLHHCISLCAQTAQGENTTTDHAILAPRRSQKDPYVVSITPMRETEHSLSGALITLLDPNHPPDIRIGAMAELYHLTAAETAVCQFLVQGLPTSIIAETRNVSVETIRNQVKAIYSKAQVTTKLGLMQKALSLSPPID